MTKRTKTASIEQRREARRRRKRRRQISRRVVVTLLLLVGICIGICFTPVFHIKEIQVSGTNEIPTEEVIGSSGVTVGQNIFNFNIHDVAEALETIPYVDEVTIRRNYPNRLVIEVREAVPVAYVTVGSTFAVVDKDSKVLEICEDQSKYKIPLIHQTEVSNYTLGEKLTVAKDSVFLVLLEVATSAGNHQFAEKIAHIYNSGSELWLQITDLLKVRLGGGEQLSARMNMLKAVLANLPTESRGTLDMTTGDKVYLTTDES